MADPELLPCACPFAQSGEDGEEAPRAASPCEGDYRAWYSEKGETGGRASGVTDESFARLNISYLLQKAARRTGEPILRGEAWPRSLRATRYTRAVFDEWDNAEVWLVRFERNEGGCRKLVKHLARSASKEKRRPDGHVERTSCEEWPGLEERLASSGFRGAAEFVASDALTRGIELRVVETIEDGKWKWVVRRPSAKQSDVSGLDALWAYFEEAMSGYVE